MFHVYMRRMARWHDRVLAVAFLAFGLVATGMLGLTLWVLSGPGQGVYSAPGGHGAVLFYGIATLALFILVGMLFEQTARLWRRAGDWARE